MSATASCPETRAQAVWTKRPCAPSTKGCQRIARRATRPPPKPVPESTIHSLSSCSSRIALSSLVTQCQAFKQPITRPMTSSISVQACLPGWFLSNQSPSVAPSSVGIATDQPIKPIMPRPNQTLCVELRRALSFRAAFTPTSRLNVVRSFPLLISDFSFMMKPR